MSVHWEAQKSSTSGSHSCISGSGRKLQLWTLSVDKNFREKAMRRTENYSVVGPGPNSPSLQVLDLLVLDWGWGQQKIPGKRLSGLVAQSSTEEEAGLWT